MFVQDRLETLHHEADNYRLLQNTRPQRTCGVSRFFQQLPAFWRKLAKRWPHPAISTTN